ncbi:MAG: hypothetical protein ACLVIZ_06575 [Bifidobacterium pseudocatenulatum]
MNTTANADAMTAILRQISLDWTRTISYGRSYIAIFFAYVPGFTCLMAATGSTRQRCGSRHRRGGLRLPDA